MRRITEEQAERSIDALLELITSYPPDTPETMSRWDAPHSGSSSEDNEPN